jgi:hypothetical protein
LLPWRTAQESHNQTVVRRRTSCCSWSLIRWVLMKVHISWIGLIALKVWQNVVASSVQPLLDASIYALFHKWILRLIGLFLLAVALVMICTNHLSSPQQDIPSHG